MLKNILPVLIPVLIVLASCQKKALPVITERKTEPFNAKSARPVAIAPDTAQGRLIFTARCGRCHGLPEPGQYTIAKWEPVLASMMPKARLSDEQKLHVTAWVNANAAGQVSH